MNNSAAKVGEIFTEAGAAFNKLAEMTMLLHPMAEHLPPSPARWIDELKRIAGNNCKMLIEKKRFYGSQSKFPVKRKIAEEKQTPISTITASPTQSNVHTSPISQQVTLNMLNAQETEMEDLRNNVKLEFESSTDEVTT